MLYNAPINLFSQGVGRDYLRELDSSEHFMSISLPIGPNIV